ncbi:Rv0361 family membrane protein [Mycolicibacterium confluentis]|uniref:Uncharacterized protein n=1 Tax=Mycolicibacterium confluentis TaxID=28047 RepID=A0A7I7Y1R6_9MYCO|nr:DUF4878 domain-containing protein [Mycolicibacterium confluentis]MCV7320530.1 DUF4878 domain-containing protein [Mycolicibacterium confluentis]ORV30186.1 hypothetical protein AWB99_13855 [Mycolicibacterium confluentis]BBZ35568.1 hypothetical protein MCNF_41730 [Mycolicibacterium confluentis]
MSNPPGPDQDDEQPAPSDQDTAQDPSQPDNAETEIFSAQEDPDTAANPLPTVDPGERRFTAPSGMDAGSTQVIDTAPDPVTEVFTAVGDTSQGPGHAPKVAAPQAIPARPGATKPPRNRRSWGWVLALILVIAALAAVAVLGTVLLTRNTSIGVSQEDRVKDTIMKYDTAIEKGDLATLRGITCGQTAESYNNYDQKQWDEIHRRVADAGQYPVIASVDQVVVNGEHAEANVTTFMESDPSTRSTRSLDLQFRDDQWKICQDAGN